MRYPQYQPGARWRVDRNLNPFTFVVVGRAAKPCTLICQVVFDKPCANPDFESEYPIAHLKKYSVYVGDAK